MRMSKTLRNVLSDFMRRVEGDYPRCSKTDQLFRCSLFLIQSK